MGNATSSGRADDGDVDGIDKPSIPGESVPELRGGETELRLSVYKVSKPDQDKFCAMHTAIVIRQPGTSVLGEEYAFSPDGVYSPPTEADPDSSLTFYRRVPLGILRGDPVRIEREFSKIVREWEEKPYDAINANCYHFTRDICWRLLQRPLPQWVNARSARLARLNRKVEQLEAGTKEVHDDLERIMELALGSWIPGDDKAKFADPELRKRCSHALTTQYKLTFESLEKRAVEVPSPEVQDLATRTRELEMAYAEAVETGKFDEDAHASLLGFDRERQELELETQLWAALRLKASERATRAAAATARGVQEMRKAIKQMKPEMQTPGLIGEAARLNAKFERNRRIHAAEDAWRESWDESWKQAPGSFSAATEALCSEEAWEPAAWEAANQRAKDVILGIPC